MKKSMLNNSLAIAEQGILTASYVKLITMKRIIEGDPLSYYQKEIFLRRSHFCEIINLACDEISEYINNSNRILKVVWAGYEALLLDGVIDKISEDKKHIVIPNHRYIDTQRLMKNYNNHKNISTMEIDTVWEVMYGETILIAPFFELVDGSCWAYSYPAIILNDRLNGKPRIIVGLCLLKDLSIDSDEDYYIGALSLLTKINPEIFRTVISIDPKT